MNYNRYTYVTILLLVLLQFDPAAVRGEASLVGGQVMQWDSVTPIEVLRRTCDDIAIELQRSKEKIAELSAQLRSLNPTPGPWPIPPSPAPRPEPPIRPEPGSVPISELTKLQMDLNNAYAQINQLRSDNSSLRSQLGDLRDDLARLRQQKVNLEDEIRELNELITELRQTIREQQTEITQLKQKIQELTAEIRRLKDEVALLKEDYMFMINQFNQNNTRFYVAYDFPRSGKSNYNYVVAGKGELPRDAEIKVNKIRTFYLDLKLFIPEEVPSYDVDLIITREDGDEILTTITLDRNTQANGSHLGFYLYEGDREFTNGLPDKITLGRLFKKRDRFFEKDKHYTYEIKLDLSDANLFFPKGAFYLD